jgi:cytochrome c oxidase subunit 1
VRGGVRIGNRAWEGAHGLEWELSSPPPYHSWTDPPSDALINRGAAH